MPTREEITKALRHAETLAKMWRNECILRGMPMMADGIEVDVDYFRDIAAQVEAMRCETCKHWLEFDDENYPVWECLRPREEALNDYVEMYASGPEFGCFHHKERK